MATANDHRKQAEHNERFLDTLNKQQFPDWAATVIFYAAVHRVQRLFETLGGSGGSHHRRNKTLRSKYPKVWKQYQPLYTFSRLSRYRCMETRPEDVAPLETRYRRVVNRIDDLMR